MHSAVRVSASFRNPFRTQSYRSRILTTMANFADRLPENATGRYYVDSSCIDCDQCRALGPEFFGRLDDSGLSIVSKQPESAEDIARMEEILATCATGSIGNDGVC